MKCLSYEDAINLLTSQGRFYINLGLNRVQSVLDLLGNPQDKLKCIHVAGTNGKGSVCSILSAVLSQSGLKTGLFTSPHVFEYTERIKINDADIDKDVFAHALTSVITLSQKNDIHLTEFEILTVVAFVYFAQQNVDIVVLETGLGGRLDATNVINENIFSVITHIDFDHTERLGESIEKIAAEKAGIIKENCPVVISADNAGYSVIKEFAAGQKSSTFAPKEVPDCLLQLLSLKGSYQKENLTLALKAVEILQDIGYRVSQKDIEEGLSRVKHPCRFEYLPEHNILIDGAHNLNGIVALRKSLDEKFSNQKIRFIFGCLNNKDYKKMVKALFKEGDEIYFYQFDNQNSCSYEELASVCPFPSKPFKEFSKDINSLSVICGSFYMIKELLIKMGIK